MPKSCIGVSLLLALWGAAAFAGGQMCVIGGVPAQTSPLSCQSRFLALALSEANADLFPAGSYEQLTELEKRVRGAIETAAGGDAVTHGHWRQAVRELTGNHFELVEHELDSVDKVFDKLVEIAGWTLLLADPASPAEIESNGIAGVSIRKIDQVSYAAGHVVSVLSVDLVQGKFVIANSWDKDENNRPIWEGRLVTTDAVTFKKFGDNYLVYEVRRID